MPTKVLIVAYSWSGNTAKMAAALQRVTGATQVELTVPAGTFPQDMYATSDVANQQLASGNLPRLTSKLPDLTQFDTILVGGPVWSGKVATPVRSLLGQLTAYTGTLAPFYTDAGTPGDYEADFAGLAPQANVVPGLGLTASDLATADQPLKTWWESFK